MRQPVAWELHFTRNSTTNIAHGENEGTKQRNSVSVFFFLVAHMPDFTTCCGATITVWELNLMDRSKHSLRLGLLCVYDFEVMEVLCLWKV